MNLACPRLHLTEEAGESLPLSTTIISNNFSLDRAAAAFVGLILEELLAYTFLAYGPHGRGGIIMVKRLAGSTIVLTLATILVLLSQVTQAQDRAGTLQGVVKNASGAPLAGAFVKMKNAERRLTFMVISQDQG